MQEVAAVRVLVDRAVERLRREQPNSPLLDLEMPELRRILGVVAFRKLRELRREIEAEMGNTRGPADGSTGDAHGGELSA